jgi:hypothetical protein
MRRPLSIALSLFVLVISLVVSAPVAHAFCGFYVARADGALYNRSSTVVYSRSGWNSVITMSSDYRGTPAEFAMIVPTPGVLNRDQVTTVPAETIAHLDRYTAPRLVEYFDDDPCAPKVEYELSVVVAEESAAPHAANAIRVPVPWASPSNANSPSAPMTFKCSPPASPMALPNSCAAKATNFPMGPRPPCRATSAWA